MNTPEKNKLLHDLLNDQAGIDHRAALHTALLKEVRLRRHQRRTTVRLLALAASLVIAFGAYLQFRPPQPTSIAPSVSLPPIPLPPIEIVHTSAETLELLGSPPAHLFQVGIVQTLPPVDHLDDAALLALFADQPALLAADASGTKHLFLFADAGPIDQSRLRPGLE